MVDDFQFNKQFRNMGIDTDAVKNTQVRGSKIEVIHVDESSPEAPKQVESSPEEPKSVVSDDALESLRAAHARAQELTNSRIENLKAEVNKVLGQFHEQIQSLRTELSQLKRASVQSNNVQQPQPQQQAQQNQQPAQQAPAPQQSSQPKGDYEPGGSKVSVENIFDFSNAKDFKRC